MNVGGTTYTLIELSQYLKAKSLILRIDENGWDPKTKEFLTIRTFGNYIMALDGIIELLKKINAFSICDEISDYTIVKKETEDEDGRDKKG